MITTIWYFGGAPVMALLPLAGPTRPTPAMHCVVYEIIPIRFFIIRDFTHYLNFGGCAVYWLATLPIWLAIAAMFVMMILLWCGFELPFYEDSKNKPDTD